MTYAEIAHHAYGDDLDTLRQFNYREFKGKRPFRKDEPISEADLLTILEALKRPNPNKPERVTIWAHDTLTELKAQIRARQVKPINGRESVQIPGGESLRDVTPVPIHPLGAKVKRNVSVWELTYYFGLAITCLGLLFMLKWVAIGVIPFYVLASFGIMESARKPGKTWIAENGGLAVVFLMEGAAWFIHQPMFNAAAWLFESNLPWKKIEWYQRWPGDYILSNQVPGIYACVISTFIALICVYAVGCILNESKQKELK